MFTGIVQEIGVVLEKKERTGGALELRVGTRRVRAKKGGSIAVNGVCLTAAKVSAGKITFDVVAETIMRTNLDGLHKGAHVNLEPSLRLNSFLDGHLVAGHIDATVRFIGKKQGAYLFELPRALRTFIAEKASVALNGVSLTVANVSPRAFSVALVPFTLKHTNLGLLEVGATVNLEIDLIARYLNALSHS